MATDKVAPTKRDDYMSEIGVSTMSWDELRAFAKAQGIPPNGTRTKLEAKIKKQLNPQGKALLNTKTSRKGSTKKVATKKAATKTAVARKTSTKKAVVKKSVAKRAIPKKVAVRLNAHVTVGEGGTRGLSDGTDDFKIGQRVEVKGNQLRGFVVDGTPRIQVALETGITQDYSAGKLNKLPPIL